MEYSLHLECSKFLYFITYMYVFSNITKDNNEVFIKFREINGLLKSINLNKNKEGKKNNRKNQDK